MSAATLPTGRAAALFVAPVPAGPLTRAEATPFIRDAVRSHGGVRGCTADVAFAFGEYPETAAARMRWARATVADLYPPRGAR